jgi:hypothetical protein
MESINSTKLLNKSLDQQSKNQQELKIQIGQNDDLTKKKRRECKVK